MGFLRLAGVALLVPALTVAQAWGWGVDGHHLINRLAATNLPSDVPDFVRTGAGLEALVYYAPEPDHWRGPLEPELRNATAGEHYIDMEYLDLLSPASGTASGSGASSLPRNRYDYIRAWVPVQAAHPELQLSAERVGLQPYQTDELYQRLKSAFRDYRAVSAAKEDTRPVEAEIVFLAGWLGHYVADGSMPLHTSNKPNGWIGANPNGYTTDHKIHGLFESDFVKANVTLSEVAPLMASQHPKVLGDVFDQYMGYLGQTHTHVEEVYRLEKAGGFTGAGTPPGKALVDQQLVAGAIELRDLIYTAWIRSADPLPARGGPGAAGQ